MISSPVFGAILLIDWEAFLSLCTVFYIVLKNLSINSIKHLSKPSNIKWFFAYFKACSLNKESIFSKVGTMAFKLDSLAAGDTLVVFFLAFSQKTRVAIAYIKATPQIIPVYNHVFI